MKIIQLTKGYSAKVDDEDYPIISKNSWSAKIDQNRVYAIRWERKGIFLGKRKTKVILMHRQILKIDDPEIIIDHINGDCSDNQKHNLRVVTNQQNFFNRSVNQNNSSGYKGVSWNSRSRKWVAQIQVSHQKKHIGFFDSPVDAAIAYDNKAKELFGQYARLNFP